MLSILKASAGSGKTYQLTRDYIVMLLGEKTESGRYRLHRKGMHDRHRHILAITFTNKATEEMKGRIIYELALLAGMEAGSAKKSDYEKELTRLFGCSAEQLRERAREALEMLLFDYNSFNVSTIDSFFQLILRTFAYEAELEGDYDVTLDRNQVVKSALDSLLSEISHSKGDSGIGEWLEKIMQERAEEGASFNYFNRDLNDFKNVVKFVERLLTEDFMSQSEKMEKYYASDKLEKFIKEVYKLINVKIAKGKQLAEAALAEMETTVLPSAKTKFNVYLCNALKKMTEGVLPGVTGTVTNPLGTKDKDGKIVNKGKGIISGYKGDVCEEYPALFEAVERACAFVVKNDSLMRLLDIFKKGFTILRMMKQVVLRMEELRVENNSLLLNDANTLLRRIIGEDDAPFVYERVGMKLHHLLIDEFQDTSGSQWEIIRPLINDNLACGFDNLIIGDEKQSIYRFRGSDSSLIRNRVIKDVVSAPEVRGDKVEENTNWRSTPEVVEFNNRMFRQLAERMGYGDIYGNVEQQISPKKRLAEGYVSAQMAPDAESYEALWRERMTMNLKRQILEQGYKGSDICVLTRGNAEAGEVIAFLNELFESDKELSAHKLVVISDDSLLIDRSPAVKRLLSGLRSIATQRNALASGETESGDRKVRTGAELVNLLNGYEDEIGRGASASEALKNAVSKADKGEPVDFVKETGNSTVGLSLPVLVERMIDYFFPAGSLPREEMIYVLAFEDVVLNYCILDGADLQGFLRWWDVSGYKSTLSSAKNDNAVRVMTIHKSKGLEFKCVYLCQGQGNRLKRNDSREWFEKVEVEGIDPELIPSIYPVTLSKGLEDTAFKSPFMEKVHEIVLDALNVEYVAFTRAIDELVVTVLDDSKISVEGAIDVAKLINGKSADIAAAGLKLMGVSGFEEKVWGNPQHKRVNDDEKRRLTDTVGSVEFPKFVMNTRMDMWKNVQVDRGADEDVKRVEGTNMHKLMSMIKRATDVRKAVARGVRMGIVERDECRETERFIENAVASVSGRGWFDADVRIMNERHIVLDEKSRFNENNRIRIPDRVVMKPDGSVEVIDYKFGEKPEKKYSLQVKRYVDCLRRAGYDDVNGYVWYVNLGKVTKV